uniref:Zinc finger, CCHC-type n=1 Tax=Tanacetum cinerariifolium TaxID=118510 RepID=A0A699H258_TANCI|nr:zinc finger, CCHC-type [Tanacetum cinerariifolium]
MEKEKNTKTNEVVDKNVKELSKLNALEHEEVVDVKKELENRTDNEVYHKGTNTSNNPSPYVPTHQMINPNRTPVDYFRPSHESYKNTIELPDGSNDVPLRSDTIQLVKNGCSFYGLRSEDPNQHLKDFFKLMDSLDLDVANRERTLLHLFQFSLRDQARNWLERESLSKAWTRFKDLLKKVPHHGIDLWLQIQIFYDHVSFHFKSEIDRIAGGKLRDYAEESSEIIENLTLYDHDGWDDPRDFTNGTYKKDGKVCRSYFKQREEINGRMAEMIGHLKELTTSRTPKRYPSHEGYQNTIELPDGSNVVPLRFDTIRFEARVKGYMAAHTKRMDKFKEAIFKQRKEINNRMAKMFGLLKELTASKTPKRVLVREEVRHPITKNVNLISLVKKDNEKNTENNEVVDKNVIELSELNALEHEEVVDVKKKVENKTDNEIQMYESNSKSEPLNKQTAP